MTEMQERDYVRDFDLDDPYFANHFGEVTSDLQGTCPVVHSNALGGYKVVVSDEAIREVAANWRLFSNRFGYEPNRNGDDNARLYPLEIDPPYQSSWRSVIGPYLSPKAIANREDSIRAHVNDLLDDFIEDGSCDFVDKFAAHLPGRVFFSTFLQVPLSDLPAIQEATDDAVRNPIRPGDTPETYAARRQAGWNRVGEFLDTYMTMRENEPPRGDFVDAIMRGVVTENGEEAPRKHKLFVMIDMLAGGMTTTTFLLAGVAQYLATNPEGARRLAEDPSLHPQAVEEFARYYASILALGRTALEDTVVEGEPVKKGDMLMLAYSMGCRDPRVFENPNVVDIDRKVTGNLAFGYGPHRCPGNHIAKLQARVTLKELLRRLPDIKIAPVGESKVSHSTVTRNWDTLPITFTPGPRGHKGITPRHLPSDQH